MSWTSRIAGALTIGAVAAVVWRGSHAPMAVHAPEDAMLRLAWSARPERIEVCRSPTADEIAGIPPHMRQQEICEGVAARYRLEVRIDGELVAEQEVRGGGLRHDRRLFVFRELPIAPGGAHLAISFTRIETPDPRSAARSHGEFVPPVLMLDERVRLRPREVLLVTYAADRRALAVVQRDVPLEREPR